MSRGSRQARGAAAMIAALVLLAALGSAGCDTIAEVSFANREFGSVSSVGVVNGGACEEDDKLTKLRFVLLDEKYQVIRPNDILTGGPLDEEAQRGLGVSLERGRLYSVAAREVALCAQPCEQESDCPSAGAFVCGDAGYCVPQEFTDLDVDGACHVSGLDLCRPYDPEVDNLGNEFTVTSGQNISLCRKGCTDDDECNGGTCVDEGGTGYCSVNVLGNYCEASSDCPQGFQCSEIEGDAENRKYCVRDTNLQLRPGTLKFVSPQPSNGVEPPMAVALVLDNSGSLTGFGVSDLDSTVRPDRRTDPRDNRLTGSLTFLSALNGRQYATNTVASLWSFNGDSELGVNPLVGDINASPVRPYISDFGVPGTPDYTVINQLSRAGKAGRSPVFAALNVVSQNMLDLGLAGRRANVVVLFTDGPDDSLTVSEGADEEQLAQGRRQWEENFQEAVDKLKEAGARVFIIHLDTKLSGNGVVSLTPDGVNARPYPLNSYGQTGPIEEYSRIACETQGQYIYTEDASSLNSIFTDVANMIGGMWEVEVGVESVANPAVENGAYRLGMDMSVTLSNRNANYFHAPYGKLSNSQVPADTRTTVFRREGTDPDRLFGQGEAGGDGGEN